jgi:hypothetical protein
LSDKFQTGKDSIQLKWIHDSIVSGSKLPFKNYQISALFQNLKFSVSSSFSMEEIEKLIALVEYYGGEYVGVENIHCTHLIWFIFFLTKFLKSYGNENVNKFGNKLVTFQWINDCVNSNKLLNVDDYKPLKGKKSKKLKK